MACRIVFLVDRVADITTGWVALSAGDFLTCILLESGACATLLAEPVLVCQRAKAQKSSENTYARS